MFSFFVGAPSQGPPSMYFLKPPKLKKLWGRSHKKIQSIVSLCLLMPSPMLPTRENPEVPVAENCLKLCLWYVNHQIGAFLIIKVNHILLIYLHMTYFFHWINNSTKHLEKVTELVKVLWLDWKVHGSNLTECLAWLRYPTSLQGSWWPSSVLKTKQNNMEESLKYQ